MEVLKNADVIKRSTSSIRTLLSKPNLAENRLLSVAKALEERFKLIAKMRL